MEQKIYCKPKQAVKKKLGQEIIEEWNCRIKEIKKDFFHSDEFNSPAK